MARSITFTVDGPVDTQITITEVSDGNLRFDVDVLGSGLIGDLRGLFFDINGIDASTAGLSATGVDGDELLVTGQVFKEESISEVQGDVNMKGPVLAQQGRFDAGIEFGTEGIGADDVSSVSFVLASDQMDLSLDSLDLQDLGLRYTSVATEIEIDDGSEIIRIGGEKIAGETSGVARNDAFEVDENSQNTEDLLANDTNGIQAGGVRKSVISVVDSNGNIPLGASGFERTVILDGLELGTFTISTDGYATFVANGADVDKLGHDAIKTYSFTYETQSLEGNLATADGVLTIDGQNDQPVAVDLFHSVSEDDASVPGNPNLTGDGITEAFVASDDDIGDLLSFEILSAPTDQFGNQYGQVTNNNDGTFTFNPLDNFQFLEAGESREVTFQYRAVDDSGVGTSPVAPEESDTSDAKTVSITVEGEYDAPTVVEESLLFTSNDQSMWDTGPAIIIDWREFYGVDWNPPNFSKTILKSGGGQIVGPVTVAGVEIFPGLSVTTPSVKFVGGTSGRVGVSPYFQFDSGSVDSSIPIDVDLTYSVQYESGDTVTIDTGYIVQNGAYFETSSPSVTVGLDLVFELSAFARLEIGDSSFGSNVKPINLFPAINANIDEGAPVDGWPTSGNGSTTTLFEFSSANGPSSDIFTFPTGQNGDYVIPIFDDSSLVLSFPDIDTTGNLVDADTLTSTGSDDVAILTLDLDDILSQSKYVPPMRYTDNKSFGFKFDLPDAVNAVGISDVDITLASVGWDVELVDVDLIGTLTAVQDFTLNIDDLPLILTLENGDTVTNFSMGDTIQFDLPDWDVDTLGDADGQMDYSIDIDIDALFNNWTTLDFDLVAVLRALKANFSADTFFTDPVNIKAFGNAASNYFAYEETFDLLNVSPIAELWGDEDPEVSQFELLGFNTESFEYAFDIA